MSREPIPTSFFALVVVRLGRRFLLTHEKRHGGGWYFPAGRVDPGESFVDAAVRETLEETNVPIVLDGVLRIEHTPGFDARHGARVRVIFVAHPKDDTPPKSQPDEDTLGAAYFTLAELEKLPLRGADVLTVLRGVDQGVAVYPLSLFQPEGAPMSKQ